MAERIGNGRTSNNNSSASALQFDFAITQHRLHATQIAKQAIQNGYRTIIAIGGDGTNSEVVNGIMTSGTESTSVKYGLIPIGSGNDWARQYKLPKKWQDWLPALKQGKTVYQDVGKAVYKDMSENIKQYYFVNVAGLAYDAFVVKWLEEKQQSTGSIRYFATVLRCLFKYRLQAAQVEFDEEKRQGKYYTINIGICRYSGGGMSLTPHAQPDDGYLALTLAGNLTKISVLANLYRLFSGTIHHHPKVEAVQCKKIRITATESHSVYFECDGELLGTTPVEISIVRRALQVIVP